MKYCPKCDELIPLDAVYCQYCGVNTQNPDEDPRFQDQDAESSPTDSRTKRADTFTAVPFSHVLISLFLLLITFWGVSISLTILPIYIDPSYSDYILPIAIGTQVLFRALIAILAVDGRYFERIGTIQGKIAMVLLSFIPLGALYSFLYAARSLSRRKFISTLSSSAVGSAALSAVLISSTYSPLTQMVKNENTLPIPTTVEPMKTYTPTTVRPTPEKEATMELSDIEFSDIDTTCVSPQDVSIHDEGEILSVCGEVTNYGELDCPDCSYGNPSYIILDGAFTVISYDWHFTFGWLRDCLKITDKVEVVGGRPVFYFSRAEGYTQSKCKTTEYNELICQKGGYFKDYDGCE